jgi:hypothetical protein
VFESSCMVAMPLECSHMCVQTSTGMTQAGALNRGLAHLLICAPQH